MILSNRSVRNRMLEWVPLVGALAKPIAAVAFAWESQSIRSVGCSAAARQAARFTAVVVLPTPPFWFATAMIRAKYSPASENLANAGQGCKMFHVEHLLADIN